MLDAAKMDTLKRSEQDAGSLEEDACNEVLIFSLQFLGSK